MKNNLKLENCIGPDIMAFWDGGCYFDDFCQRYNDFVHDVMHVLLMKMKMKMKMKILKKDNLNHIDQKY